MCPAVGDPSAPCRCSPPPPPSFRTHCRGGGCRCWRPRGRRHTNRTPATPTKKQLEKQLQQSQQHKKSHTHDRQHEKQHKRIGSAPAEAPPRLAVAGQGCESRGGGTSRNASEPGGVLSPPRLLGAGGVTIHPPSNSGVQEWHGRVAAIAGGRRSVVCLLDHPSPLRSGRPPPECSERR